MRDEMTQQHHVEMTLVSWLLVKGCSRVFWSQVTENPVHKGCFFPNGFKGSPGQDWVTDSFLDQSQQHEG